ncbi:hypothetical protein LP420_08945 [Massilia sp. B-10]|nr:hypothetical protein LP420_08945 [Massilia sp. B-10]
MAAPAAYRRPEPGRDGAGGRRGQPGAAGARRRTARPARPGLTCGARSWPKATCARLGLRAGLRCHQGKGGLYDLRQLDQ